MPLGRRKDKRGAKAVASASPHIVAASLRAMSVALSLDCAASKATGVTLNMAARCVPKHAIVIRPWLGRRSPGNGDTYRIGVVHQATVPRWNMGGDDVQKMLLVALHCLMQVVGKRQLEWICVVEAFENCLQAHCRRSERS